MSSRKSGSVRESQMDLGRASWRRQLPSSSRGGGLLLKSNLAWEKKSANLLGAPLRSPAGRVHRCRDTTLRLPKMLAGRCCSESSCSLADEDLMTAAPSPPTSRPTSPLDAEAGTDFCLCFGAVPGKTYTFMQVLVVVGQLKYHA